MLGPLSAGVKQHDFSGRQSCNGQFTSAEDPGFRVIKDIVEKKCVVNEGSFG